MNPRDWLLSLEHFGIKLGLDTITTLLARLGDPQRSFASVHVAGTNGKGSVTAMVDQALREAGHRSARYTSPHLVDLSERFVINGRPVDEGDLDDALARVRETIDSLQAEGALTVTPTFFEVTTAAAFELFARAGVSIAVCETGLGGRLDATNVLLPIATAITTVGLDHQQHLGSTVEAIAAEKAGIIKPRVPVAIGALPDAAARVVAEVAVQRRARIVRAVEAIQVEEEGDRVTFRSADRIYGPMRLGLEGRHQIQNAQVAIALLELIDGHGIAVAVDAIARGFEGVQWPGRLDWRRLPDGREALLDAAHNPEGAAALAEYLHASGEILPLVFGAMSDKDVPGILRTLLPHVGPLVCTRAATSRAADPAAIADIVHKLMPDRAVTVVPSSAGALEAAWRLSRRVVVAGSIFLLGDIYRHLQNRA